MNTYNSKNAVAVNVLRSWLRAAGIAHSSSTVPGCDLTVEGPLGDIEVIVALREDETAPCEAVSVLASDITGKSKNVALAAFWSVSRAAGAGEPVPFNRGEEPDHKLSYHDDEFLVTIRSTETRRSPDPTPAQFEAYAKPLKQASQKFFNLNRELCQRWGYDFDDLLVIARTLFINFCARYEKQGAEHAENIKLLHTYLAQRFAEGRAVLLKKERNTFPDADTVSIGLLGKNYGGDITEGFDYEYDPRAEEALVDLAHRTRNRKLNCSNPTARKASAAKLLEEGLAAMDHDQMVYVLQFAAQNILISHDARREAGKRLRAHAVTCSACQADGVAPGVEEDEDAASVDAGSAQE